MQDPDGALPPAGPDDEPASRAFSCPFPGTSGTDRFTRSGPAGDMPPDPLLAAIIDTGYRPGRQGAAGLGDDQLIGVIAAGAAGIPGGLVCADRGGGVYRPGKGERTPAPEFAADELACELHLTGSPPPGSWITPAR